MLHQDNKDVVIYAFNATGKTRLSYELTLEQNENETIEALCYNAIIEDFFTWDNDENKMYLLKNSWIFEFIKDEGLDRRICDNFSMFTDVRLQPLFIFDTGEIQFRLTTGDDNGLQLIKISKGEETLFKWSVYFTIVQYAIEILSDNEEDRSTSKFNNLKCIIIDDPISSLDDYKIYTLSMQIIELMKDIHNKNLNIKFLITTHHSMFYNIIHNALRNRKDKTLFGFMYNTNEGVEFQALSYNEHPLTHHICTLTEINESLYSNNLQKKHFNMLRSILEKFSVFLGHNHWEDLFGDYDRLEVFKRLINMNSHEKYFEFDSGRLTQEQIDIFKDGYEFFKNKYKFKIIERGE